MRSKPKISAQGLAFLVGLYAMIIAAWLLVMWPTSTTLSLSLLLVGTLWQVTLAVSGVVALFLGAGFLAAKPVSVDESQQENRVGHTRRAGRWFFVFAGVSVTLIGAQVAVWSTCRSVVGWSCVYGSYNLAGEIVGLLVSVLGAVLFLTGVLPRWMFSTPTEKGNGNTESDAMMDVMVDDAGMNAEPEPELLN
jgi:hypothetical protein